MSGFQGRKFQTYLFDMQRLELSFGNSGHFMGGCRVQGVKIVKGDGRQEIPNAIFEVS